MRRTTEAAPSAGFTATIGPAPPWHSDEVEHTASIWGRPISALCNARTLPLIAAGIEFAIVSTAAFGAGAVYHQFVFGQLPFAAYYLAATLLLTGLFVLSSGLGRDYSLKRLLLPREQVRSVFLHWNTAYSLFVFALFITYATDFYSRGSIVAQYVAALMTVLAVRLLMTQMVAQGLRRGRLGGNRVIIVGESATATHVARRLRVRPQGVDVVRVIKIPPQDRSGAADPAQLQKDMRAALETIESVSRNTDIDDIVVCLPWADNERIRAILEGLAVVPATIHLAPDSTAAWAQTPVQARVGSLSTIRLSRAPLTLKDRILKRAFDLVVASLLLTLLLPVFAVIAVLIKLTSRGPVLFRQRRHGFNQSEFRIFKFRTMTTLDDGPVVRQATRDDARVTRIGRILRRRNFDELPQLLNVLAGHMSLVGPRPHAVAHNNEYEEKIRLYARRHNVKPGITGWSQVNGYRGETDTIDKMRKRVEYDLYYIDNWSLPFDVKILLMTIFSPEAYRNAY
jgi:Undecaprenyl-phosphate glucose phosphotransferase